MSEQSAVSSAQLRTLLDSAATQQEALVGKTIVSLSYDGDGGVWLNLSDGTAVRVSIYENEYGRELQFENFADPLES
jgi:hypothetical protein